ncbi:dihydroxyacetone kinase subunit DhaK [Megamonas hypermegale]|uniref:dihydroxyacetone kinase subunit DhaK n=1 Tax=Megamonas hypermegale TaxID=158847 RepID=UPI0025A340A4|nr:dihydroxyacetone kinase subunit DhaK [Megamonas hypermegale]MDM8143079.1 dihydroxyacetone kinase subunit DhaK [Megamonas hypermegale]
MKKIINKPETIVREMCKGFVLANPTLEFVDKYKIVKKKTINKDKVSLISGGGSGHEPAHAGFVGKGMLDAAVCGDVFASPSQVQVYQAIKQTASDKGTLLIIKNYSGDMMNFQSASYLAEMDGLTVDYVKVEDDIAVQDSLYTVGRRGVAGTVFVHKIAGAAAEKGLELAEVKRIAQKAADNVRSIGFALTSCTVPAKGTPTFELGEDEIEYGVGIHGEPGIQREKISTADELAARMTDALAKDLNLTENDEIAVLINGFGATPQMELNLLNYAVTKDLAAKNLKPVRIFIGNYMTSIDMAGASVSILKLDEELKSYLSAPADTPPFKVAENEQDADITAILAMDENKTAKEVSFEVETDAVYADVVDNKISLNNMIYIVDKMSEIIIRNEVPFCELDSHAGDGDFGMSVAKGFKELKRQWHEVLAQAKDIGSFLEACSMVIMEHCGGASGPVWGFAFKTAGKRCEGKQEITVAEFAQMMQGAVDGIQAVGKRAFGRGAVVGDKTLIDALVPCADTWKEAAKYQCTMQNAFVNGAKAAVEGADKTKEIVARMGRAGTVGERSIGYPDAGAYALGVIFTELTNSLNFKA